MQIEDQNQSNDNSEELLEANDPEVEVIDTSEYASEEISLLNSMQTLLRMHGLERSIASIRDMADLSDGDFGYADAVSALENLEFSSSVGSLSLSKITQGHCPAIIELKEGKTAVLTKVDPKKEYTYL